MTVALLALLAMPHVASALVVGQAALPAIGGVSESNSLQTRQFRIDNARIPGRTSARQSVIAWQVTQGTWNGQVLDGLCLVLVKSTTEDGQAPGQTTCYVSNEATLAQREALLGAFLASQPQAMGPRDRGILRMEPAVITLEIEGQTVVLHLALIG
jgi:hypothetical protein